MKQAIILFIATSLSASAAHAASVTWRLVEGPREAKTAIQTNISDYSSCDFARVQYYRAGHLDARCEREDTPW